MSESLIIRFSTKGLEAAKATLKEIKRRIGEASKGIEDAAQRRRFLQTARELVQERAGEVALLSNRARRRNLLADAAADYDAGREATSKVAHTAMAALHRGRLLGNVLAGGASLEGAVGALGSGVAGLVPGLGPVAALAGAVIGFVVPILEKQSEERTQRIVRTLEARVEAVLRRADVARRFEDDPAFRREQGQAARDIVLRRQLAGQAFEGRSARLLGVL